MSCVVRALWKKLVIAGTGFEISFHHSFGVVCVRVTTGLKGGGERDGLEASWDGKKGGVGCQLSGSPLSTLGDN